MKNQKVSLVTNKLKTANEIATFDAEVKRLTSEEYMRQLQAGMKPDIHTILMDFYKSVPLIWDYANNCLRD